jgi:hypothetical protein
MNMHIHYKLYFHKLEMKRVKVVGGGRKILFCLEMHRMLQYDYSIMILLCIVLFLILAAELKM